MTDTFIRHFIAFIGTLIAALIFWAGYESGTHGWWAASISVIGVYFIVYSVINAGGK